MRQKTYGKNYKLHHHLQQKEQGRPDIVAIAKEKLGTVVIRRQINPDVSEICEAGKLIGNEQCSGSAYRKIRSKYGEKWTCDQCALMIARTNEMNWGLRNDL